MQQDLRFAADAQSPMQQDLRFAADAQRRAAQAIVPGRYMGRHVREMDPKRPQTAIPKPPTLTLKP